MSAPQSPDFHTRLAEAHNSAMECAFIACQLQKCVAQWKTTDSPIVYELVSSYLSLRSRIWELRKKGAKLGMEFNRICGALGGMVGVSPLESHETVFELASCVRDAVATSLGFEGNLGYHLKPPVCDPRADDQAIEAWQRENLRWGEEEKQTYEPEWLAQRFRDHRSKVIRQVLQLPKHDIQSLSKTLLKGRDLALKEWTILSASSKALSTGDRQLPAERSVQSGRLRFDQPSLTVYLDERPIRLQNAKAFLLYKSIAEHGGPITRAGLRSKSPYFRGDKTVPKLRDLLPAILRRTIKSNNTGYWLQLPLAKQIRT